MEDRGGDAVERLIFHVDVNSAFLSWEATRRVREGAPDLRLVPSAIGGDPEKRTGIILAKSIPAKAFGVKTGEPVAMALRKCPSLILAPPDFTLYSACSKAFMDICRDFAPAVEPYSIDECFLDMTGTHLIYPDPVEAAHTLRRRIRDTLGFTVNIGVGSNKFLAKTAGDFEKPDKVHTLFSHEIADKLWRLSVRDMIGVGAATAEKLERSKLCTIGDAARVECAVLQAIVGNKAGEYIHARAHGIDDSPVLATPEEAKGYSVSVTLEENVTDRDAANGILLALCDSVSSRMRADGAKAMGVGVTVRTLDFKNRSHQRKLSIPTDITEEIVEQTRLLMAELWDGRTPLRLIGVSLFDVTREDTVQMTFFGEEEKERLRTLDRTVDELRRRFGMDGIVRGGALEAPERIGRKYKAKHEQTREETK